METNDPHEARPWQVDDLYNPKAHLRAVPIIVLDKWEQTKSDRITTEEIHKELLSRGLLPSPMSKKGTGNLVGAFRQRERKKNLWPPLVEQVDQGIWRFNLADYEGVLRQFRSQYPIRFAHAEAEPSLQEQSVIREAPTPPIFRSRTRRRSYGAPMDFRGLRHSPINELGVVFLFGIVCKDLDFIVESVHSEFPDCEAKRCVDAARDRWERVRIEFEYESRNFLAHGHDPEQCEVLVCWTNNWPECPLEVIELRDVLKRLNA